MCSHEWHEKRTAPRVSLGLMIVSLNYDTYALPEPREGLRAPLAFKSLPT